MSLSLLGFCLINVVCNGVYVHAEPVLKSNLKVDYLQLPTLKIQFVEV